MQMSNRKEAKRRLREKGRGEASFLRLPHYILKSQEFGNLSGNAVKLLLELCAPYKGFNNGDLSCAFSQLKDRGWKSSGTLAKAIRELRMAGFIVQSRQGGKNRCSLYAITWWNVDPCPGKALEIPSSDVPSHAWKKQIPALYSNQLSHYSNQSANQEAA
jgi:hypothetical protein